jgi:hypothetical protein
MEPLLFADENAPEWAFSKRKGVKSVQRSKEPKSLLKKASKILITFSKSLFCSLFHPEGIAETS